MRISMNAIRNSIVIILSITCHASIAGSISGAVTSDRDGLPLPGATIAFLDGLNAEEIAVSETGNTGLYNSGLIPVGIYRIRFNANPHKEEFYGALESSLNDYCESTAINVDNNQRITIDQEMKYSDPVPVVVLENSFRGSVTDSITNLPIQGVEVQVYDARDGYLVNTVVTDEEGQYGVRAVTGIHGAKIRFFDPLRRYFPHYYEANNTDDFCIATALTSDDHQGKVLIDPIPANQAVNEILETLSNLELPSEVDKALGTPITQAARLITDSNSNNDTGSCGQLASFISRVDIQEKIGKLTTEQAEDLRLSAEAASLAVGCQI